MARLEGPQGALAPSTSVVGSVLHLGTTTELSLGAAAARSPRQAVCVGRRTPSLRKVGTSPRRAPGHLGEHPPSIRS